MQRSDRLILLCVLIAFALWRLVRYMRLGMGKRRPSLGIAAGLVPPAAESAAPVANEPNQGDSLLGRIADPLVTILVWLAGNLLIWIFLLKSPFLSAVPPLLLGVTGIFANFYLIPFARASGRRCRKRLGNAQVELRPR